MLGREHEVAFGKLRALMWGSVFVGAVVFLGALLILDQFRRFELGWAAMAFAFGAIAWSAIFYFGCLMIEGSITTYILSDDTEIKGESVEMVTRTRSSGDARLDGWIDKFVFARNTFGPSVLPLLLLVGVVLFG